MSHGMLCSTVHWGDFEFSAELRNKIYLCAFAALVGHNTLH